MLNSNQTLKGGFERAMPIIGAYWATLIAKSRRIPIGNDVAKILDTNPNYISDRIEARKHRNSKII